MKKEIRVKYKIDNLKGEIKDEITNISKIIIEEKNGDRHIYDVDYVEDIQLYKVY
jgi:hypothetical protein